MNKKILIVGGVAGGASVAARVRRLDEQAEITMFEKGPDVSFSNCSLPFYLSGVVEDAQDLVLMDPVTFQSRYKIDAKVNHEVTRIDRDKKTVTVRVGEKDTEEEYSYDILVLAPGAAPIKPASLPGIDSDHVFTVRNVVDISELKTYTDQNKVEDVAIIGGGFIGLEVAENLHAAGKKVHLIEKLKQVMAPLDEDMAQLVHKELYDNNTDLILGDGLASIEKGKIVLESGKEIPADAVVLSIGVRPESALAKAAGLATNDKGAIQVNHHYQTNDPSIYAVGDAVEVSHHVTHQKVVWTMAGSAQRAARAAADHMYGKNTVNHGVIGSSVLRVFDLNVAMTGINEKTCRDLNLDYRVAYVIPKDKVSLMPEAHFLFTKVLFEYPTGRLLGAQLVGKGAADKRADVVAALIFKDGTIEDLKDVELSYSPLFGTAKDALNMAGLVGCNILNGEFEQVHVSEVRTLVEDGAFILDVREPTEFEAGHLTTAVNIPFSEFRNRLAEIPKDKTLYVHCLTGQRSYNVVRALNQLGFHAVNIAGSFLGIGMYEYFLDQTTDREAILTAYPF